MDVAAGAYCELIAPLVGAVVLPAPKVNDGVKLGAVGRILLPVSIGGGVKKSGWATAVAVNADCVLDETVVGFQVGQRAGAAALLGMKVAVEPW